MMANFLPAAATLDQVIVPCQWLTSMPSRTAAVPASAAVEAGTEAGAGAAMVAAGAIATTTRTATIEAARRDIAGLPRSPGPSDREPTPVAACGRNRGADERTDKIEDLPRWRGCGASTFPILGDGG